MKKDIKEAIKEHLHVNAFAADPNNSSFVDRFIEHTKAAAWGAEWRINSVWHDVKEMPEFKRDFIYQAVRKSGEIYYGTGILYNNDEWEFRLEFVTIERWAYIDDLLPNEQQKP